MGQREGTVLIPAIRSRKTNMEAWHALIQANPESPADSLDCVFS